MTPKTYPERLCMIFHIIGSSVSVALILRSPTIIHALTDMYVSIKLVNHQTKEKDHS